MQVFGFGDGRNILFAVDYYYSFLYQGMGGSCPPSLAKNLLIPHLVKFSFLAVVITCVPFCFNFILVYLFVLTSYSLYTQIMLSLILVDVEYLQNVVFSFEKALNGQNHLSPDSHENPPQAEFRFPPPVKTIWKPLIMHFFKLYLKVLVSSRKIIVNQLPPSGHYSISNLKF